MIVTYSIIKNTVRVLCVLVKSAFRLIYLGNCLDRGVSLVRWDQVCNFWHLLHLSRLWFIEPKEFIII